MAAIPVVSTFANDWGIIDSNGDQVFEFDTFLVADYNLDTNISKFPVEHGAFADYNKVLVPRKIKVEMAVSGQTRVAAMMATLEDVVTSTELFTVVTPEMVYANFNFEKTGYKRQRNTGGIGFLQVKFDMEEVLEITPQYSNVRISSPKKPASKDAASGGKAQAGPPPWSWGGYKTAEEIKAHVAQEHGRGGG